MIINMTTMITNIRIVTTTHMIMTMSTIMRMVMHIITIICHQNAAMPL